ncbi:MAG: thiamine-phosphate kinase [Methanomicrobiales archaeon]|nr:thiamine-phosphate kinase [Methanomicrobiales archaeon]
MDERELKKLVREVIGTEHTLDDCAVLPCRAELIVATTDMLHEETDFPAGMTDWQIGWMSAAVTLSDIAAMGARPAIVLLAVGLDRSGRLRQILEGSRACCERCGAVLAGGDLDSHRELTIVSSGIGFADRVVRRAGAEPGDLIGITGTLGRAQAALEGYRQYERFLFEPVPKVDEGRLLAQAGVSSMMDISDGLVASLYDILDANEFGFSIDSSRLPLIEGVDHAGSRGYALYGGGDFELLFTCPAPMLSIAGIDIHLIGSVIEDHRVFVDGKVAPDRGYRHTWNG